MPRPSAHPVPSCLPRRAFLSSSLRWSTGALFGASLGSAALGLGATGCQESDPERYTEADRAALAEQQRREREQSGQGPFGVQRFKGYRGLSDLPWFELDRAGVLRCVDERVPRAIDFHCHLGMSVLFRPELDLQKTTDRVHHLLDCDATDPGCDLDLDVYVNANFDEAALDDLECTTIAQGLWGNDALRSQTIPNLLAEMDACRVEQAVILPIKLNFPFGDDMTEHWRASIQQAQAGDRLIAGASVHPRDPQKVERLESFAKAGARVIKMHPTVQAFYPDEPDAMEIYAAADRLGLVIFFHGGRAGIEPASRHPYAMPRHYEGALRSFPNLPFVIGHGGARDGEAMLELALQNPNAWLGIHGQGVTQLDRMIERTGGKQLLFGTDWPFYHLAASLAKVLIVTDRPERSEIRHAILRGNAEQLLG